MHMQGLQHTTETHNLHIFQTLTYHHIPVPRVSSLEASGRTLRRRRDDLMRQRVSISGSSADAQAQLCLEVKALPEEERQSLLKEAGVTSTLDATQSLAIKSELSLPWYRLRILRT